MTVMISAISFLYVNGGDGLGEVLCVEMQARGQPVKDTGEETFNMYV